MVKQIDIMPDGTPITTSFGKMDIPDASPAQHGLTPAGGLANQVFRVNEAGDRYEWGDSTIIGKIDLLPFRPADFATHAPGWHFCNGDLYPLSGAVGAALNALPATFKADWGIVVSGTNISIPNMFSTDGRGYFLRAANGTTRQIGQVQEDAQQRISGAVGFVGHATNAVQSNGSMYTIPNVAFFTSGLNLYAHQAAIDSSRQARTDTENRPLNIGMTPAIFLGV